jgi:DNA processing protein
MPIANVDDWIALNMLPGVGPLVARRALARFGSPGAIAYRVPAAELATISGFRRSRSADVERARRDLRRRVDRELRRCRTRGVRVLVAGHDGYPAALEDLPDAPILLYELGAPWNDGALRVAIVGARQATLYGKKVATGLATGLAARNIEVVSGGARGIDTCAHGGALAEGGRTVAVLGSGLDCPYPGENADLFDRIADNGTLLSEFALAQRPKPENFPRRNRVISGLSAATVVVEAATRSGSLSTAAHALEQGREVLAIPGPVSSIRSAGCHRLIQQGAKLVQNVEDILDELSPMYRAAASPPPSPATPRKPTLLPDEDQVLALLDPVEAIHLDDLAERAPFGIARLQAALFGLELQAVAEALPGGYYRRLADSQQL